MKPIYEPSGNQFCRYGDYCWMPVCEVLQICSYGERKEGTDND